MQNNPITSFLYIDPGSGSLFFQALLSAGISILLFFKNIKAYIGSLLEKKKKDDPMEPES